MRFRTSRTCAHSFSRRSFSNAGANPRPPVRTASLRSAMYALVERWTLHHAYPMITGVTASSSITVRRVPNFTRPIIQEFAHRDSSRHGSFGPNRTVPVRVQDGMFGVVVSEALNLFNILMAALRIDCRTQGECSVVLFASFRIGIGIHRSALVTPRIHGRRYSSCRSA